jgi:multiple sugar transport system permease protein
MSVTSLPSVRRRSRYRSRLLIREYIAFYLFASPWLIGLVMFTVGPMITSLYLSFTDYAVITAPSWIGIGNYVHMFTDDPLVWQALRVTGLYCLGAIPLSLITSFLVALLMHQQIFGVRVFRTIYYLPSVISGVPVALLWMWILNPEFGLINNFLRIFGIEGPKWLFSTTWAIPSFVLMSLWGVGVPMVTFLAGLQGIPAHLYEAAEIDGAGPWRRFRNVTLPMLSPYLFFNLIVGVIGTMQIFSQAYVMTQGGPDDSTLFYAYHLFNSAFRYFRMGYASAMAWILLRLVLALTLQQLWQRKRWVHYERT